MYCRKCGTQLNDNAKFCKKCGCKVSTNETLEKNAQKEEASSENLNQDDSQSGNSNVPDKGSKKKNGNGGKKGGPVKRAIRFIIMFLLIAVVLVLTLDYFDIVDFKKLLNLSDNETKEIELHGELLDDDNYRTENIDADAFFEEKASVLRVQNVDDSEDNKTGVEIIEYFSDLGFDDQYISAEYSMAGEYGGKELIGQETSDKHPVYEGIYVNSSDQIWMIYYINGRIMAMPVSYNLQSGKNVKVIISENESIMSYDGTTNQFYETIPDPSVLDVKSVEEITAETLDQLTYEVIDSL
jgi:hypothetical protein